VLVLCGGSIIAEGDPQVVFSDQELLDRAGLI